MKSITGDMLVMGGWPRRDSEFSCAAASMTGGYHCAADGVSIRRHWVPHVSWLHVGSWPRFYDFNVYSSYKVREKLEYMHGNPVKRGLVENPGAWMWSSFLSYEKGQAGLIAIDPLD